MTTIDKLPPASDGQPSFGSQQAPHPLFDLPMAGDQEPPTPPPPTGRGGRNRRRRTLTLLGVVVALIALIAGLFTWYLSTGKPLSELPGLHRNRLPHYLFSVYGVDQPLGVAVSPDGERVYVTETGGKRAVHVYDRSGKQLALLQPPGGASSAHVPVYVAIDPVSNDVYVSDRMTATVYVYGANNRFLHTFTPHGDLGGAWAPLGLAFDKDGRLYVTDVRPAGGHRVLLFDRGGNLIRSIVPPTGNFLYPNGVVVDARGNLEVADSNNSRVLIFDRNGTSIGRVTGGGGDNAMGLPRGTTVDDQSRLYIVDAANHLVWVYQLPDSGKAAVKFIGSFGTEGTVDGAFEFPNGVAADSRARIYVTDRENNRVQVWSY